MQNFETNFELVENFMRAFGQEVKEEAEFPDEAVIELRMDLIAEEAEEVQDATRDRDLVNTAKELVDLLYVVYGTGHALGIDLDACFQEVHASNMSKLGADLKPIYREDGKVLKGPHYFKADLTEIVSPQ